MGQTKKGGHWVGEEVEEVEATKVMEMAMVASTLTRVLHFNFIGDGDDGDRFERSKKKRPIVAPNDWSRVFNKCNDIRK